VKPRKILIAQPNPVNNHSPFFDLEKKRNLKFTFKPFVSLEGQVVKNIRLQKINIQKHTSVILTSRHAIDHYFRICDQMRITVPNSLKYFCISEAVSYYLQKYIAYRKRKIYSANNNFEELVELMNKNENENFLLVSSDYVNQENIKLLDESNVNYKRCIFFKIVPNKLKIKLSSYYMIVFYSPRDIESLFENFPEFNQGNIKIAVFGEATYQMANTHNLDVEIKAPTDKFPSLSMALDSYFRLLKG
tara:strand:- start:1271 stop:2011 length:741 start_codon:yes stop_codon:yes gene_type:complete